MEQEEIIRKLNKLETDQQKERSRFAVMQKQLTGLEKGVADNHNIIVALESELTQLKTHVKRYDQLDSTLTKIRTDLSKAIENIERQRADQDREVEKLRLTDLETLNKALADFRKAFKSIKEIEKSSAENNEKVSHLDKTFNQLTKKVNSFAQMREEDQQGLKVLEETMRQDSKRITALQTETIAIRKRNDEHNDQIDLEKDNIRKLEVRLTEFQQGENDRRQTFNSAIEKLNLQQMEKDRLWKEWQSRFEMISSTSKTFEDQAKLLDETFRNLKKAQSAFEEINQRLDRRLNEVTEMQRLTDERIRQEWQGFKGDDQKRWTTYTLGQEELQREINRQLDKSQTRIMELEDLTSEVKEMMVLAADENKKRYQTLIDMSNEWLESNERTFGRHK
jgi:chromosome segregation ATPase